MLQKEEVLRYSRQVNLSEVGMAGQLKFKKAKVLIVGAGGLGSPILNYLNACGIGTIGIIDFDAVSISNLNRQTLYSPNDIGHNKASIAQKILQKQNLNTKAIAYPFKLNNNNAVDIFSDYEIIIDACDDLETRYLINDTCVQLNLPFVYGAVQKFEGQVSVLNYNGSGNYRTLFPLSSINNERVLSCEINGVIGVIPGIIGLFQANEVIKIILGFKSENLLVNQLLIYNFITNTQSIIHF
jgi:molybdopterin/thiamine biosynthesis adenylyltransferase